MACDPIVAQNFAARNDSRILYAIGLTRAQKDPWATVLDSGEWAKGEADNHTVVIGREAAPADPLDIVMPQFTAMKDTCGQFPAPDAVGSTQYTYHIERKKGTGPAVCLYAGIDAFKDSYKLAATSLAELVTQKITADQRNVVLQLSGVKAVVNNTVGFYNTISGTAYALATPFVPGLEPNTVPTLAYVKKLGQFLTTDLGVPPFEADQTPAGAGVPANIKVIAGEELLEAFRNEVGTKQDTGFLTTGGFEIGKKQILSYVWEGPMHGVGFARDPLPIRLSSIPEDGVIRGVNVVPPKLPGLVSNGQANVPNPAYWVAPYEIFFIIAGKGAFLREVLKGSGTVTLGDSSFKFPDQYNMGELQFFIPQGSCDAFKEIGFHTYSIARAIRPQHPHYIMPVLYKRCENTTLPYCVGNTLG